MAKRKCHLCGVMTARPVPIWYQAAIAPGVNAPGSKPKEAYACPPCADFLGDEDAADYHDEERPERGEGTP